MGRAFSRFVRPRIATLIAAALLVVYAAGQVSAHPLGNFTINHFTRLQVGASRVRVHYVVDMAEISTFQELQAAQVKDVYAPTTEELQGYLNRVAPVYAQGLVIEVEGARVLLQLVKRAVSLPTGSGGLNTLRVECDFVGALPARLGHEVRRLRFEDTNHSGRVGWHELVVEPESEISIFDSTAYSSPVTDELRAYPQDALATPLDERSGEFSYTSGSRPAGAQPLMSRSGQAAAPSQDKLAALISASALTPTVVLLALLTAAALGGLHALSPGHGKTIVGAYLVGSRGTAHHAAFLGLTVTVTHTAGVFALGIVTLFASQYIVPERLFPVLSFISGAIVISIGATILVRRLSAALAGSRHPHDHSHHDHSHQQTDPSLPHSHGGMVHSHLPPCADGAPISWRSLLALGISGGLLPCPSALVVLLAAIALHRVAFGLLLVFAFSLGLAAVLTAVGLVFLYARRLVKVSARSNRLVQVLPVLSAAVITCAGLGICYEAVSNSGIDIGALLGRLVQTAAMHPAGSNPSLTSFGIFGVMGLGLVFGLKHALEADHVMAVSAIVSEFRSVARSAFVGAMWGAGHTLSLVAAGAIVLVLKIAIPDRVVGWLELGVAVMIVGLGAAALRRALGRRPDVHSHQHDHGQLPHKHFHFHDRETQHSDVTADHSHFVLRMGAKPLIVGMVHGLAGSATLTLLVLSQISSVSLGILYLAIFGAGSILGMLLISATISLPFAFSSVRFAALHRRLQLAAAVLSIAFGLWYGYQTGVFSVS